MYKIVYKIKEIYYFSNLQNKMHLKLKMNIIIKKVLVKTNTYNYEIFILKILLFYFKKLYNFDSLINFKF